MDEQREQSQLEMLRTLSLTTQDLIDLDTAYQMGEDVTAEALQEIKNSLGRMSEALGAYINIARQQEGNKAANP